MLESNLESTLNAPLNFRGAARTLLARHTQNSANSQVYLLSSCLKEKLIRLALIVINYSCGGCF